MKKRSGQILILVLLVVVVALAVGLSVASRNITNLRTSTQTEESQRAFSAAEGGIENILSNLNSGTNLASNPNIGTGVDVDVPIGSGSNQITAKVNVRGTNIYETSVEEGVVAQVKLDNYTGHVYLDWILASDTQTENLSSKASVEVTFVCQAAACPGVSSLPAGCLATSSTSGYSQFRCAYRSEDISGQSGFSPCGPPRNGQYVCGTSFGNLNLVVADNVKFMRIRPFWRKATIRVEGDSGFPLQTYDVTSSASTTLGITRKVQVTRTALPQLPAAFDYVLFSEGSIVK